MQKLRFIYAVSQSYFQRCFESNTNYALSLQMIHILIYLTLLLDTVLQFSLASINIAFGCKQAQQYSRTHQLSFIRAVGWSAQNAFALVVRAYHCYSRTLQFSCISYEVLLAARFDVLFKSLNVTKTINTFLAHFRVFEKATNLFNATGHHACSPTPTKISIDILLLPAKTFGIKLAQPIRKMISIYFYCWRVEDVSFQSPLVGPCIQWRSQPKNLVWAKIFGEVKMFVCRRITPFCLKKHLSKHKMTIRCKNLWGAMVPLATPATPVPAYIPTHDFEKALF